MSKSKVLVVSDNSEILERFLRIIGPQGLSNTFDFAHSPGTEINLVEDSLKNFSLKENIPFILKNYDLFFSLHCKQIIPPSIFNKIKCINFHPGYVPYNRGWYPQVFSIIHNLPFGVTIHEVTEELDWGPIIDREEIFVNSWDTSESLYKKAINLEEALIKKNLKGLLNNNYSVFLPESKGEIFFKKDFEKLKELNLGEIVSWGKALKIMRALTHSGFKNAFFVDPKTGGKVHFGINIHSEKNESFC